jgi:hypothetical protein
MKTILINEQELIKKINELKNCKQKEIEFTINCSKKTEPSKSNKK